MSSQSLNNSTSSIRKAIRNKRRDLSQPEQKNAAKKIALTLSTLTHIQSASHIAAYLANDGEVCLKPFINWCWQHNKKVYLPRLHPFSRGQLLFMEYTEDTAMVNNTFGIAEPKLDVRSVVPIEQVDVILTPLVAFDHKGNRLGMGGGYYDRTLKRWYTEYQVAHTLKNYPIGIAHDCQQIEQLPSQAWDIPLPEIITSSQHIVV